MTDTDITKSPEELWKGAISLLREVLANDQERSQMERYFPMITTHGIMDGDYVVGLSDQFKVDWLSPKLTLPLERALHAAGRFRLYLFRIQTPVGQTVRNGLPWKDLPGLLPSLRDPSRRDRKITRRQPDVPDVLDGNTL